MKSLINAWLVLATLASVGVGQGKPDLDRLDEKISSHLESKLTGWIHKRVEAFGGSTTVLVQGWGSTNRAVKVAVAVRESPDDAKKEIRSYLQFRRETEELTGFGDEAYAPERNGPQIVLRKGRYVIYVSTIAHVEEDAEAQYLSQVELATLRQSEVQRITKEFARLLSSVELP